MQERLNIPLSPVTSPPPFAEALKPQPAKRQPVIPTIITTPCTPEPPKKERMQQQPEVLAQPETADLFASDDELERDEMEDIMMDRGELEEKFQQRLEDLRKEVRQVINIVCRPVNSAGEWEEIIREASSSAEAIRLRLNVLTREAKTLEPKIRPEEAIELDAKIGELSDELEEVLFFLKNIFFISKYCLPNRRKGIFQ